MRRLATHRLGNTAKIQLRGSVAPMLLSPLGLPPMKWEDILQAAAEAMRAPSSAARASLTKCWDSTSPDEHAQRCVLAHYLADQQDDLETEIYWDEKALTEFARVKDGELTSIGVPSTAGFAPSLHLNLADGYLRAGRVQDARDQLRRAEANRELLLDEGYGAMIRRGLDRLHTRIQEAETD